MMKRTIQCLLLSLCAGAMAADQPLQLPEGHPSVAHASPTTMPASATGTLRVKAVQKTAHGTSPVGDQVIVHFYQGDKVVKHVETAIDMKGEARIDDIPLTPKNVQALVLVQHGQISYQALSRAMNSATTNADVEIPVYESTKETPAWRIPMRHVMVEQTEAGLEVVEVVAVENPTDRTWIGNDQREEGATLVLRLPDGATGLQTGDGFAEGGVHFHNGTLYHVAPMTPGMVTYKFAYALPVKGGKAELSISSPALTQQLVVFVPKEISEIKVNGLQEREHGNGDGKMRMLSGSALPPGQVAGVTMLGLANTTVAGTGGSWSTPQIIAAAGLGVVLLGGIGFMLLKPVKTRPQAK